VHPRLAERDDVKELEAALVQDGEVVGVADDKRESGVAGIIDLLSYRKGPSRRAPAPPPY